MSAWEIGLWAVGAFIAVMAMVRLMLKRRDELLQTLLAEAEASQREKQLVEMKSKKETKQRK
jgi:hypothetical protein